MRRTSLVLVFSVVGLAFPVASRAADPAAGPAQTDPFAPTEPKAPSIEDQEAAVLGAPAKAAPPAPAPAPRPAAPARRQRDDEDRASAPAVKAPDQTGIAIELATTGFASGALDGGLFIGGRTPAGMIIGGFVDYGLTSVTSTPPAGVEFNSSMQSFRLGAGVREGFLRTADRRAELYGVADVSFDYKSVEVAASSPGTTPTNTWSAAGFSLALGPGIRLWVTDQLSIGYVARFRLSYLSGSAGALTPMPTDDETDAKMTQIGFDGVFQILAVF